MHLRDGICEMSVFSTKCRQCNHAQKGASHSRPVCIDTRLLPQQHSRAALAEPLSLKHIFYCSVNIRGHGKVGAPASKVRATQPQTNQPAHEMKAISNGR